jgi:hypothetical protein
MAKMGYAEAKRIRGESLSNRIASKLVGGESFGSSIGKSISEGTKARMTGLKEKVNPMNIAKFMFGGSPLAAAVAGRMTGASKENMKYFTGKQGKIDTATKIKPISEDEGIAELLNEIYLLLEDSRRARLRDVPSEEDIMERERKAEARHKALLDAINGKLKGGKQVTATKVEDEEKEDSLMDNVLGALGLKELGRMALKGLGSLATFAMGPIGAPLLAAAAIGAFGYFIYKAIKADPSYEAEQEAKGIEQAQRVGGLAGVKDEEDRIKKLPEYERTMAEIKNAEQTYWKDMDGNPQFGTDEQLKGYAKRGPEAAKAVEDYKAQRDNIQKVLKGETPSEVQAPTPAPAAMPTPAAQPVEVTPTSAPLSSVTKENLEMNLPMNEMASTGEVINNTNINTQNESTQPVTDIPSVRNLEETFQRMIFYSTRVV